LFLRDSPERCGVRIYDAKVSSNVGNLGCHRVC
jgi:hypothetical protein